MNRFRRPGGPSRPVPPPEAWVDGRAIDQRRRKERAAQAEEGDAKDLGSLMGAYLTRSSLGSALLPASPRFVAAWKKVAGEVLAARCQPARWRGGVLWIAVPDAGWKFELRWKLSELAAGLRAEGIPVQEIRID